MRHPGNVIIASNHAYLLIVQSNDLEENQQQYRLPSVSIQFRRQTAGVADSIAVETIIQEVK